MTFYNRSCLYASLLMSGFSITASDANIQSPILDHAILEKIYAKHVSELPYKEITQEPFLITFSCVPGMGKTFLSKKIAEHYHAISICSNDIRETLNQLSLDYKSREKALKEYLFYLFERYDFPNRRFILDASIDRSYVLLFPYLAKHHIPFLVIRLKVSRETVIERIIQSGVQTKNYLPYLDQWFKEYEAFGAHYKDYFLFNNNTGCSLKILMDEIGNQINNAKLAG